MRFDIRPSENAVTATILLRIYAFASLILIPVRGAIYFIAQPSNILVKTDIAFLGLMTLLQILGLIGFGTWLHEIYSKLPHLGWTTRYTPPTAVALFFVPFSGLFRGSDVAGELAVATDVKRLGEDDWEPESARLSRSLWWLVFLAGAIVHAAATVLLMRGRFGDQRVGAVIVVLLSLAACGAAAFLAARFLRDFENRLQQCVSTLRRRGAFDGFPRKAFHRSEQLAKLTVILMRVSLVVRIVDLGFVVAAGLNPYRDFNAQWLNVTFSVTAILAGITFIAWSIRAMANAAELGLPAMPRLRLLLGFVVPGWNLVHPFQIMSMLWRGLPGKNTDTTARIRDAIGAGWLFFVGGQVTIEVTAILASRFPELFEFDPSVGIAIGCALAILGIAGVQAGVAAINGHLTVLEKAHEAKLAARATAGGATESPMPSTVVDSQPL